MGSVGRPAIMSLLLLLLPLLLPASLLTISSWSRDLEQKTSTLTRMCELPSVTLAWKSQLRAMEELRSINQTGLVVSQGTAPSGRTWFHSGPPTTLSTSPPTRCPTR